MMRNTIAGLSMLLGSLSVATPAVAQVSVTVSIPGVSIGIHQPVYPDLVLVPGYPVYYAPQAESNYFFYDGLYWVYQDDNWYMSSWYDGPWDLVEPDDVPLFVLRVPVRYYVRPPVYFHGWIVSAPPRWHYHWGPRWTRYHHGWDRWDHRVVYTPAPLPVYQRHYHGERYPRREYQRVIRHEHYHYQARDQVVRRHEQRPAPRPQADARPATQNPPLRYGPYSSSGPRPQRERDESRRPEAMQVLPSQRVPVVQEQRPQAQPQPQRVQPEHRGRPDVQRAQAQRSEQREPRERGEPRRPEGMQVLPQQRAAILQERQQQQQQRQQPAPRAQQAPRPQQAQGRQQNRGPQDRGDRPQRGGDRGAGRQ